MRFLFFSSAVAFSVCNLTEGNDISLSLPLLSSEGVQGFFFTMKYKIKK